MGEATPHAFVIAGLGPAIHRAKRFFRSSMDARVKPAHDERIVGGDE
jgi:hypothetical protein